LVWRIIRNMAVLAILAIAAMAAWNWFGRTLGPSVAPAPGQPIASAPKPAAPWPPGPEACAEDAAFAPVAKLNAASLTAAAWSVFGRPEMGWEIYAPLTAREIGARCAPDSPGFAKALAAWQHGAKVGSGGIMDEPTLQLLRQAWLARRPFVLAMAHGCPPPPPADHLAWASKEEGYAGKPVQLRPAALAAYRAMIAAARADQAELARDHRLLTIFSGYRDPVADAAACATTLACGTITRARCSAHRTGLAMDIYLGSAPGAAPEMSDDANRLFQSRSAAYRWMVANAARFGFVNYPFEPWHWEWTGEAP
jgi:hypothetical protein